MKRVINLVLFLIPKRKIDSLNEVRKLNPNRLIIAHININSIRNKFEMLKVTITDKTDILLI